MSAFAAKNVFVNPFYQEGVGRRTGIVLNKDVRKDSDGFEVFDDYWSESENDATVNTTCAAEKENIGGNKPTPRRKKSSLKSMPSFSADVASSDREQSQAEIPQEISQAAENASALEADLTGSIIKAPASSLEPLSALRQFKTRQRLSFSSQELTSSEESQTTEEEGSDEGESQESGGESSEGTIKAPSSSQSETSQDEGRDSQTETGGDDAGDERDTTEEEDSEKQSSQATSEPSSQGKEPKQEDHIPVSDCGVTAVEEVTSTQQSSDVASPSSSQESAARNRESKRRSTRGKSAMVDSTSVEDSQDPTVSKGKGSRKSVPQSKNNVEKEETVEKDVVGDSGKEEESRCRKSTRQSLKLNKEDDTTKNEAGVGKRKSTRHSDISVQNQNELKKEAGKEPDTRRRKSTRRSKVNEGKDTADKDKEDNPTKTKGALQSNMSVNKGNDAEEQALKEAEDAEAKKRRKSTRRSNRAENKEEENREIEADDVKTRRSRSSCQSNRVENVIEDVVKETEDDRSARGRRKGRSIAGKEVEVEKDDKVVGEDEESKGGTEEKSAGENDEGSQGEESPETVTDKEEEEESGGETDTQGEKVEEPETETRGEKDTEPETEEKKNRKAEKDEALKMEADNIEKTGEEQVEEAIKQNDEVIVPPRTNVIEDDDDDDTDRFFFSIRANKTAPSVSDLEDNFDVADADPQEFGIVEESVKENRTVAESANEQSIAKAGNKRKKKKNQKESTENDQPERLTKKGKQEINKGKGKNKMAVKRGSELHREDDQKKLKGSPKEGTDVLNPARGSKKSHGKKSKKQNDKLPVKYSKERRKQRSSSSTSQANSSDKDADSQSEDDPTNAVHGQQKKLRKQGQKRTSHHPVETNEIVDIDEDGHSQDEASSRADFARSRRSRRSSVHFTTKDMISVSGDISVHQVVSSEEEVAHQKKIPPTPGVLSKDKKKTRKSSKVRSDANIDRSQAKAREDDATNPRKPGTRQSGSESTTESEKEVNDERKKGKKNRSKTKQSSKSKSSPVTSEEHGRSRLESESTAESEIETADQGGNGKKKGTKSKQSSKRKSSHTTLQATSMAEHQNGQSHSESTAESEKEIADQRERRGKKKGTKTNQSSKRRSSHVTSTTSISEVDDSGVKKRRYTKQEHDGVESASGSHSDTSNENAEDHKSSPVDQSAEAITPVSGWIKVTKDRATRRQDKKKYSVLYMEKALSKAYIIKPDEEDGVRRTRRQRVRPLEYWRNERPLYERRKSGGLALAGILSPKQYTESVSVRSGRSVRQAPKPKGMLPVTPAHISMHTAPPVGTSSICKPTINVVNPDTELEVAIDAVATSKMLKFTGPSGLPAKPDDPITISKALSQKAFSAGVLTVRPFEEKGSQLVKRDTMVFNVVRGKIAMTLHKTTQILQNGDWFFVPKGNVYNIKNLRKDEAKLTFFQLKSS